MYVYVSMTKLNGI